MTATTTGEVDFEGNRMNGHAEVGAPVRHSRGDAA